MHKIEPISLCSADFSDSSGKQLTKESQSAIAESAPGATASRECHRNAYHTATMLGLAISMGTSTILLTTQEEQVIAGELLASEHNLTSTSLSTETDSKEDNSQPKININPNAFVRESVTSRFTTLIPPALKHNLGNRETFGKISFRANSPKRISSSLIPFLTPRSNKIEYGSTASVEPMSLKSQLVQYVLEKINTDKISPKFSANDDSKLKNWRSPTLKSRLSKLSANNLVNIPRKLDSFLKELQNIGTIANNGNSLESAGLNPSDTREENSVKVPVAIIHNQEKKVASTQPNVSTQNILYKVKPGDTLDSIARRHKVSIPELIRANNIKNPNLILVNQQLKISGMELADNGSATGTLIPRMPLPSIDDDHEVQLASIMGGVNIANPGRGKKPLLAEHPKEKEIHKQMQLAAVGEIVEPQLPALSSPDLYLPDSPPQFNSYIWPAKGQLTSGYGRRWGRMHKGIDIAGPIGTPILAAAPGEVVSAGWNSGGYGNLVKIKHPDGSLTLYAHNHRILVRQGQKVRQGQQIAEMGSTGRSTGPHLHFEVHPSGKGAVNPVAYLPKKSR